MIKIRFKSIVKEDYLVGTEFTGGRIILNTETGRKVVQRDIRVHQNSFPFLTTILPLQNIHKSRIQKALSEPRSE